MGTRLRCNNNNSNAKEKVYGNARVYVLYTLRCTYTLGYTVWLVMCACMYIGKKKCLIITVRCIIIMTTKPTRSWPSSRRNRLPTRWAIIRNKIIFYIHTTIGISQVRSHYSRRRPYIFIRRPAFDYSHTDEIATLR